jgi:hypothetical protein
MLGKYDESYVYEKETDILSDSDPTDCEEDYGESDVDAGQDGGDERDPQDDEELDFIDNGSYVELSPLDLGDDIDKSSSSAKGFVNKGHCTYHMPHSGAEFIRKPTMRFRESFVRRPSGRRHLVKDEKTTGSPGPSSRRASVRKFNNEEGLGRRSSRDGSRHRRPHEPTAGGSSTLSGNPSSRSASEKKRLRCSMRRSCSVRGGTNRPVPLAASNNGVTFNSKEKISIVEAENSGVYNLNRILMQKMLFRVNGNGTRSAGNTPVSIRKKIVSDEVTEAKKKVLSPSRVRPEDKRLHSAAGNKHNDSDLQVSPSMADALVKKRSYSISCGARSHDFRSSDPSSAYLTTFSSELALIEADREADRKYKELILEAEHILVSMKGNSEKFLNVYVPTPPPPPPPRMCKGRTESYINESENQITETDERVDPEKSAESESVITKPAFSSKTFNSPKRIMDESGTQSIPHSRACNDGKRQRELGRREPGCAPDGLVHASSSSSMDTEGSATPKQSPDKSPAQQRPPLVTFRSIDLGHELGGPGYCPQSEPVKRKVYTCSATFDRLQRTLESSQHQTSLRVKANVERKDREKGKNIFSLLFLSSPLLSSPLLFSPLSFSYLPYRSLVFFCLLSSSLFAYFYLLFLLLFSYLSLLFYTFPSLLPSTRFPFLHLSPLPFSSTVFSLLFNDSPIWHSCRASLVLHSQPISFPLT